jgi:catechol 2,3-dioxygenase-like lactoylglutathione lyase family enzyme
VELRKIGWVGTRTENPEATADFFGGVLGLRFSHSGDGVWVFQLPDGSKVEVFGPSENQHFITGPVVEFLTDDVTAATEELRKAGVPIVSGPVYFFVKRWDDIERILNDRAIGPWFMNVNENRLTEVTVV